MDRLESRSALAHHSSHHVPLQEEPAYRVEKFCRDQERKHEVNVEPHHRETNFLHRARAKDVGAWYCIYDQRVLHVDEPLHKHHFHCCKLTGQG